MGLEVKSVKDLMGEARSVKEICLKILRLNTKLNMEVENYNVPCALHPFHTPLKRNKISMTKLSPENSETSKCISLLTLSQVLTA